MKKEKREKPEYSVLQNLWFLIKEAWMLEKETVYLPVVKEVINLSLNLLELFIVPVILQTVEQRTSLGQLLAVIGVFTMASIRTRPKPWSFPLELENTFPTFESFLPAVKLVKEI